MTYIKESMLAEESLPFCYKQKSNEDKVKYFEKILKKTDKDYKWEIPDFEFLKSLPRKLERLNPLCTSNLMAKLYNEDPEFAERIGYNKDIIENISGNKKVKQELIKEDPCKISQKKIKCENTELNSEFTKLDILQNNNKCENTPSLENNYQISIANGCQINVIFSTEICSTLYRENYINNYHNFHDLQISEKNINDSYCDYDNIDLLGKHTYDSYDMLCIENFERKVIKNQSYFLDDPFNFLQINNEDKCDNKTRCENILNNFDNNYCNEEQDNFEMF